MVVMLYVTGRLCSLTCCWAAFEIAWPAYARVFEPKIYKGCLELSLGLHSKFGIKSYTKYRSKERLLCMIDLCFSDILDSIKYFVSTTSDGMPPLPAAFYFAPQNSNCKLLQSSTQLSSQYSERVCKLDLLITDDIHMFCQSA
eukprot:1157744-Pelagomonas_calceolata.AAC.4